VKNDQLRANGKGRAGVMLPEVFAAATQAHPAHPGGAFHFNVGTSQGSIHLKRTQILISQFNLAL